MSEIAEKILDYHHGYPGETLPLEEVIEFALAARVPCSVYGIIDWGERFAEQALRRIARELVETRRLLKEANRDLEAELDAVQAPPLPEERVSEIVNLAVNGRQCSCCGYIRLKSDPGWFYLVTPHSESVVEEWWVCEGCRSERKKREEF